MRQRLEEVAPNLIGEKHDDSAGDGEANPDGHQQLVRAVGMVRQARAQHGHQNQDSQQRPRIDHQRTRPAFLAAPGPVL